MARIRFGIISGYANYGLEQIGLNEERFREFEESLRGVNVEVRIYLKRNKDIPPENVKR
jgi:hypothetical protein